MFDYAQKLKLAAQDTARRVGIMAAGGVVLVIGAGFLLAALWSFLAVELGWGSALASLTVGILFLLLGVGAFLMARKVRHPAPSVDELKAEVELRTALAVDAATDKARVKAMQVIDMAENKTQAVVDRISYKTSRVTADAEAHAVKVARDVAASVGLDRTTLSQANELIGRVKSSRSGAIAPMLGALAIGIVIADRLRGADDK